MKNLLVLFILSFLLISGCAVVKTNVIFPSGVKVTAEYWRVLNQKIDEFRITDPNGWQLELLGQESELKTAFNLGALSVTTGGK